MSEDPRPALEAAAAELGVEAEGKTDDELLQAVEAAQAAQDPANRPPAAEDGRSREELLAVAGDLQIKGRTRMSTPDLVVAIAQAQADAAGNPRPSTPEEVGRPPLAQIAVEQHAARQERTRHYGVNPDSEE